MKYLIVILIFISKLTFACGDGPPQGQNFDEEQLKLANVIFIAKYKSSQEIMAGEETEAIPLEKLSLQIQKHLNGNSSGVYTVSYCFAKLKPSEKYIFIAKDNELLGYKVATQKNIEALSRYLKSKK